MLEVKNLSKYYGKKMAIEDISFSMQRGEVVGLLGHNGSGKSTTMSIMTGCLAATAGSVFVDGEDLRKNPAAAKMKIGYLPEIPPLYLDMTVQEQLTFAANLRNIPTKNQDAQISLACQRLQITGARGRLLRNLSKGYRQRVGFAQALIGEPQFLILDEPTVGLDPRQIMEIRAAIADLGKTHTILLSSHILSEIAASCNRILVISNGHLVADDTPAGLVAAASEKGRIILQADGETAVVKAAVETVAGVKNCTVCKNILDGSPEYHIEISAGCDIHRALFAALAKADCPIQVLKPMQANLEDVFLQLTQDTRYKEE
ncbi:MAG: ABC transporter ATP-binding protein [Ruthenibacterium sp.]